MKKYGLIGYPLGHSFSKNFFNEKFHSESIDAEYVNFEIPSIKELPGVLLENHDLAGLNVTIPYKEQVIPYLDELDSDAAAIGAVNHGSVGIVRLVGGRGNRGCRIATGERDQLLRLQREAVGLLEGG